MKHAKTQLHVDILTFPDRRRTTRRLRPEHNCLVSYQELKCRFFPVCSRSGVRVSSGMLQSKS
jgi:hypothetical protein